MNSHYNPYTDISSSPHPPSPDNNNYAQAMSIGNNSIHHNGHVPIINPLGGQQGFHQINNNNAMMKQCAACDSEYKTHFFLLFFRCISRLFHILLLLALYLWFTN